MNLFRRQRAAKRPPADDIIIIAKDGSIGTTDADRLASPWRRWLRRAGLWGERAAIWAFLRKLLWVEAAVFFGTIVFLALGAASVEFGLVATPREGMINAFTIELFVFFFIPAYIFQQESKAYPFGSLILLSVVWLAFLGGGQVVTLLLMPKDDTVLVLGGIFYLMNLAIAFLAAGIETGRR
ncbi:MAG: hypothetical protein B193_1979 [Solidesulfovibrio magneticus str. Maddingley MBC34]|uniref:Uncharacterized protein n=1 Tax=Solidesulfovibrio magneticus str. Maddingley MBC34 TaxID=1206767 RepID=K6FL52_9BACT|nr:MAG: hypothetical protein B193_1979 [Solidesulfovibrio magneticus str. Maddingley MBC34]